jgi:hypothetical protein
MGTDHGVTFSVSETGIPEVDAKTSAVWYASTIGEFMKHPEMEIFTPWSWHRGMWEVLHVFSRYNKTEYVQATSSEEEFVSAHPTLNTSEDSLTVVLINRAVSSAKNITLNFKGFVLAKESFETLTLTKLPARETFVSHTQNALQKGTISPTSNSISLSIPAMSIITMRLKGQRHDVTTSTEDRFSAEESLKIYPNPASRQSHVTLEVRKTGYATLDILDNSGRVVKVLHDGLIGAPLKMQVDFTGYPEGIYIIRLKVNGTITRKKISIP